MLIALILRGVSATSYSQSAGGKDGLAELVVPLNKPSEFLESARKALDGALTGIRPQPHFQTAAQVATSGEFVRWGDLFKTGDCFAVAELAPPKGESGEYGVAFAQWTRGSWELRQLWRISTTWRAKGWTASDGDYLPTTPATEPFALRDLGGGRTPELIVAGEVEKYFQEYYLFRFSRVAKKLNLVASAMGPPTAVDRYVVLPFNSGRRAIWQEWQFLEWRGDDLVLVASWHDEVGYGSKDPTFAEGKRSVAVGHLDGIKIGYGAGIESEADTYELTRNEKPFGRMRVEWRDEKTYPPDSDEIEKAWLFEKITGLPRRLYPACEGTRPIRRFEKFAKVKIEGNDEATKFFGATP